MAWGWGIGLAAFLWLVEFVLNKNAWYIKALVWVIALLLMFSLFRSFADPNTGAAEVTYSNFLQLVRDKQIKEAKIPAGLSGEITATRADGNKIRTNAPFFDQGLIGDLINNGVAFDVKPAEKRSFLVDLLINSLPLLLLIGVWIYFMRQMQGGGKGSPFSFGKSKARMLDENNNAVTFADVAGCDEAKEEVKEVVDFLKDPEQAA